MHIRVESPPVSAGSRGAYRLFVAGNRRRVLIGNDAWSSIALTRDVE
jgi:hypothetical protein